MTTTPTTPLGATTPIRRKPPAAARPRDRRSPARPDPERLAAVVARLYLEVLARRRPLVQLRPAVTPALYAHLLETVVTTRPAHHRPATVVRTISSRPSARSCETTVLIRRGHRTTAVAVRLDRYRSTWRITALSTPEQAMLENNRAPC